VADERADPEASPTRGSAEPTGGAEEPTVGRDLDEELLAEGGAVPRVDAVDPGDSGAPVESVGTGAGAGAGPGARYEGAAGGAGAKVAGFRERGDDAAEGEEAPAGGGPAPPEPT
jgi:hypothetical protein